MCSSPSHQSGLFPKSLSFGLQGPNWFLCRSGPLTTSNDQYLNVDSKAELLKCLLDFTRIDARALARRELSGKSLVIKDNVFSTIWILHVIAVGAHLC
ncbi:hypothetical protein TSAR_003346 [Trichomalopsis sarcophagae]|uniref:Uncharacterized protein n=1 Tax=Trichomalopsis sarcophagae TaxID=543379 RepID=A0A232FDA6_9HYME|nr:hypothetical protein TSAR_003346 [Trichomalopsis sarcophagae]